MGIDPASSVEAIRAIDVVPAILDTVCRVTGMGFAAIARVTGQRSPKRRQISGASARPESSASSSSPSWAMIFAIR